MKNYPGQNVPENDRALHLWLRRLRRVAADTPAGVNVFVASGAVQVTLGCDHDAHARDGLERARTQVDSFLAPQWQEDDP